METAKIVGGERDVSHDIQLMLTEAQVLLAEERNALSVIRSGIAVMALPISVVSVLIATSRYYAALSVLHLLVPVLVLCALIAAVGIYMVVRGLVSWHRHGANLRRLKERLPPLREILG